MLKSSQLQAALEYSYHGEAKLSLDNIQDVIEAADFLRMDKLIKECRCFMLQNSHGANVIPLWRLAQLYMMNDLTRQLYHRIMEGFMQLADTAELLETSFDEFIGFVSDDHLNVRDEDKLCHVCVRWIEYRLESRRQHLFSLLKAIRVYLVDEAKLRELVAMNPLLREDVQCYEYLMTVRRAMNSRMPLTTQLSAELRKTTVPREPHGVILLHGGWLQAPCNVFEVYDPSADRHTLFPSLADVDEMRAYHKMAFVNGDIFVIGGYNGNNNYHKNCRKYNLLKKTWSHVTPMNVERSYVSVAVLGRKIFAIGGYNGQFRLNTAEAFDLATNQWSFIRPMEFQRSDAACAVLDGKLYAIGGFTGTTCNRTVERYDPATDTWTSVAQMGFVRSGVSAVTLNGKIYALGGSSGSARLSSCEVYDPLRDTWSPIASMLTARSNFAAVVCDDLIYVFGGYTGESTTRLCECYSPVSDECARGVVRAVFRGSS
ncbi:kelch protein 10-like [Tropilaelaps mercedesae]|uniref:Kelch protein 10-like n=1 Tax=Tropilaelaps mercedesae TaxID=418985 RepID=A0A1V9X4G6_9ACAR|nr:kelch protein 10-like [Tropilaelaps mercedesae]